MLHLVACNCLATNLIAMHTSFVVAGAQAAQALFMNHTRIQHNMASNYKGLYGIFYKITTKVVKSVNIQ